MTDLLIRNIDARLKRRLKESARVHRRSLSDEAKVLLERGLLESRDQRKMGTVLFGLIPDKYRGDDLIFEVPGGASRPPDFE